jgi:hypothetical protein
LALLVEYGWPGNVRELRNLVESMVVLAHGREIGADDIPRTIRDGGGRRLLPVHVGPMVREGDRAQGRELEFIVRSLVELKLQVEELRRRMDVESRAPAPGWVGDVRAPLTKFASLGDEGRTKLKQILAVFDEIDAAVTEIDSRTADSRKHAA